MSPTVIDDLTAELEISPDGPRGRALYRDDRLRVIGFAFATGQGLTEHSSALPVVIQVIRGRLAVTLGDGEVEAVPGGWIHLPARLPHTVRAVEPSVMLLTMVAGTVD